MSKKNRCAFTLMEMLLVTTLVSVIGLAVFHAFSQGLRLWARGSNISQEGDTAIWMDKMGEDLRGTLLFTEIPFKGTATQLSFPAIVMTTADTKSSRAKEMTVDQIGAVKYYFDAANGKVLRQQSNYGQAMKGQWGPGREAASGIREFDVHYYFPGDKTLTVKSETGTGIPAGVMLRVTLDENGTSRKLKRYFEIPVGG